MIHLLLFPSIVTGVLLAKIETKKHWLVLILLSLLSTLLAIDTPTKIALAIFFPSLVLIDKERMMLPFLYSIPLLMTAAASHPDNWLYALILGGIHFLFALTGKMGGGDWPLAATLGFAQSEFAPLSLLSGGFFVLLYGFVKRLPLKHEVPLGPLYFCAGGLVGGMLMHVMKGVML